MDPLPPINKVCALISQEEHQRKVGVHASSSSNCASTMAFVVKNDNSKRSRDNVGAYNSENYNSGGNRTNYNSSNYNSGGYKGQRKERPFCTHFKFHGHTIEKCYKIHSYPPGFKQRQRDNLHIQTITLLFILFPIQSFMR